MKFRILSGLLLASIAPSSWAVSFDADVNSPGPGVFFGSGNDNGAWTVDFANGIELGLRTHQRYPTPDNVFNSAGNGNYDWADALGYGPLGSNRSSWNYDFSLNTAATGLGISSFFFKLYIDYNSGAGHTWSAFDPSAIPDNAFVGTAYEQNSENARFSVVGLPGYDNTIAGTYDFVLQATNASGDVLASTFMRVNVNGGTAVGAFNGVVPDHGSTAMLVGAALIGLGVYRRRRIGA